MALPLSIDLMNKTDDSSGGVFPPDYTKRWLQRRFEVTEYTEGNLQPIAEKNVIDDLVWPYSEATRGVVNVVALVSTIMRESNQQTQNFTSAFETMEMLSDDRIPHTPNATYILTAKIETINEGKPSGLLTIVDDDDFLDY